MYANDAALRIICRWYRCLVIIFAKCTTRFNLHACFCRLSQRHPCFALQRSVYAIIQSVLVNIFCNCNSTRYCTSPISHFLPGVYDKAVFLVRSSPPQHIIFLGLFLAAPSYLSVPTTAFSIFFLSVPNHLG